jgi:hypothetical protein
MKRIGALLFLLPIAACEQYVERARTLSSFEVTITSAVGAPDRRCLLPGSSTAGIDLSGCPTYLRTAAGVTIAKVDFTARAIDDQGQLFDGFNGLASVRVVPGNVQPGFRQVRFENGVAIGAGGSQPTAAFGASFGDAYVWVVDEEAPVRSGDVLGLGSPCNFQAPEQCDPLGLGCVNSTPVTSFDPEGLAYCTKGCVTDEECPEGYFCSDKAQIYTGAFEDGACLRRQPSYAAGVAGPIHLVLPNLADVNRSESLTSSPFDKEFVNVARGNMVVTGVRIDGFYATDTCPIRNYESDGQLLCGDDERNQAPEFNHLFIFTFSRPDDLFPGDRLTSVSGPMTEFNGLTELAFPLWEVDYDRSPQPIPEAIELKSRIIDFFPALLERGGSCANVNMNPQLALIVQCELALERLEAARVTVTVKSTRGTDRDTRSPCDPLNPELLDRFGQWPVVIDDGSMDGRCFQLVTRENIPFFDPTTLGMRDINQPIVGNLRQVAFNERDEPIWIIEPRDQADCPWCTNP